MGRFDRNETIGYATEIVVVGHEVGDAADRNPDGSGRQARHYDADGSADDDKTVTMAVEKAPFMKKEVVSPVGDLNVPAGYFTDDRAMTSTVSSAMLFEAFSAMTATPVALAAAAVAAPSTVTTTSAVTTSATATTTFSHGWF